MLLSSILPSTTLPARPLSSTSPSPPCSNYTLWSPAYCESKTCCSIIWLRYEQRPLWRLSVPVLYWYCAGTVPVLCWYCAGTVLVMVLVLCRYSVGICSVGTVPVLRFSSAPPKCQCTEIQSKSWIWESNLRLTSVDISTINLYPNTVHLLSDYSVITWSHNCGSKWAEIWHNSLGRQNIAKNLQLNKKTLPQLCKCAINNVSSKCCVSWKWEVWHNSVNIHI